MVNHYILPACAGPYEEKTLGVLLNREDLNELLRMIVHVADCKYGSDIARLTDMISVSWSRIYRVVDIDYLDSKHAEQFVGDLGHDVAEVAMDNRTDPIACPTLLVPCMEHSGDFYTTVDWSVVDVGSNGVLHIRFVSGNFVEEYVSAYLNAEKIKEMLE